MKKVIIISLMSCLVLGMVFANGLKVGVEAGYGSYQQAFVDKDDSYSYLKTLRNGFYGSASFEFDASESFGLKAEIGVLKPMKEYLSVRASKDDTPSMDEVPSDYANYDPLFTGYLGLQFNAGLSDALSLGLGAGMDVILEKDDEDKLYIAIGAGAEVIASVGISDSLALNVGGKFGYYFVNTSDSVNDTAKLLGCRYASLSWKAFAGATIIL